MPHTNSTTYSLHCIWLFRFFLIIFLILSSLNLSARKDNLYDLKCISVNEGLSYHQVTSISEDTEFNIWIGTTFGINRISGNKITPYSIGEDNESDWIEDVECSGKNVWVLSGFRIYYFDKSTDTFRLVIRDGFENQNITAICAVGEVIYAAGIDGIFRIDEIHVEKCLEFPRYKYSFNSMCYSSEGYLLFADDIQGIFEYDIDDNGSLSLAIGPEKRKARTPFSFVGKTDIWYVNNRNQIEIYSNHNEEQSIDIFDNSLLPSFNILSMREIGDNVLVGTDGGGIYVIDKRTFDISDLHLAAPQNEYLLKSAVSIYEDSSEGIWIATVKHGCILLKNTYVRHWNYSPTADGFGLSGSIVSKIIEDESGNIWVASDGGGINRLSSDGKVIYYPSTDGYKVLSLVDFDSQRLLMSCYDSHLMFFNKITGAIENAGFINRNIRLLNVKMFRIDRKIYFIGSTSGVYDMSRKTYEPFKFENDNVFLGLVPIDHSIYSFYGKDFYSFTEEDGVINRLYTHDSNIVSASYDNKKNGIYFIDLHGVFYWSLIDHQIAKIASFSSMLSIILYNNEDGRVWIGSNDGIYVIDTINDQNFLIPNSFSFPQDVYTPCSMLITSDGHIFCGGTEGMISVNPDILHVENKPSQFVLQEALVNNKSLDLAQIFNRGVIDVPYNFSSLKLSIKLLDNKYMTGEEHQVKIEGRYLFSKKLIGSSVEFSNLPSGHYTVSLVNNAFPDNRGTTKLFVLNVKDPWWKTIWGTGLIVIICLIVFALIIIWSYRMKKRRINELFEQKQKNLLEQQMKFMMNVSHELRTPLSLIVLPLEDMKKKNGQDCSHELQKISFQVSKMRYLIDMFMDVRKIEKGQQKLAFQNASVNRWMSICAEEFKEEYDRKGINLTINCDENVGHIDFDMQRCRIVISNFLTNALKYSPSGTKVSLVAKLDGDEVRISISDEGKGLDGNVDKLFNRFYQNEGSAQGFGIGLSYAKIIIEMHGGKIGAFNNSDGGATFYFTLPLKKRTDAVVVPTDDIYKFFSYGELVDKGSSEKDLSIDISNYSVLVVDDDADFTTALEKEFSLLFRKVYVAHDGQEAFEMTKELLPDIVVSDVMMPVCDGFELCRMIKTTFEVSHIPVVLLTALSDINQSIQGYKTGADAYLGKPFDIDYLITLLRNELYNRECIRRRYAFSIVTEHPEEITFSNPDEIFIKKLNDIILENIDDADLDLNFILEKMKIGRKLFKSKLNAVTNLTISSYINNIRIHEACKILSKGEVNISETAYSLGFATPSYFSTVFKQITGLSPKDYIASKGKNSVL